MTQETEWVRQTGQDTAPRGRKSPFDTDNLNHLLWGSKLLYQPGKSFRNSVCKRIWVQITVRSMQEWVVVFSRLPNKCHGKCSSCSIKAECRPAKQERRHPSMQQDNTEQQRDKWNSESEGGERTFQQHNACRHPTNMSRPYCVRSPCSPLCKHPPCTPSRLYSDPEQEVISYPTSASAFLSQVVNVPGSRPPKPRDRGWWRAGRVQPWRAVGWTLDWNGTTRIRWYPSLMFYPPD